MPKPANLWAVNTKWLQLDSLISLKSEIAEGDDVKTQEVVAFE